MLMENHSNVLGVECLFCLDTSELQCCSTYCCTVSTASNPKELGLI